MTFTPSTSTSGAESTLAEAMVNLPNVPGFDHPRCAELWAEIVSKRVEADLDGASLEVGRPISDNGCEVQFIFRGLPGPPTVTIVHVARSRSCCEQTYDRDEESRTLDDGSVAYLDPTSRDVDRVPGAGRVTIVQLDGSAIAISSYGGALSMDTIYAIAVKMAAGTGS